MRYKKPKNIYLYENYRVFLNDWLSYKKHFGMTARHFLEKANIKARAFMSDILAGRKKLPLKYVKVFSDIIGLENDESRYFYLLVQKGNANKVDEITFLSQKLSEIRIEKLSILLKKKNLEYFSSWKYPVIREFLIAKRSLCSPKIVVNSLVNHNLTSREVKKILNKLEKWEMAFYDEHEKCWKPKNIKTVFNYEELPHIVVHDAKKEMIDTAAKSMEMLSKDKRHATMAIRSMSEEKYIELCKKIDDLRSEFLSLNVEPGSEDRVVTLNVQAFPVMMFEQEDK